MTEPAGGSTTRINAFGPELFGLKGGLEMDENKGDIKKFGIIFGKRGKEHFVTLFNFTTQFESKALALVSLAFSPLWISVRAIVSVAASLTNIVARGEGSVFLGYVEGTRKGRFKAMGCSLLSLLTTPVNMAVEELAIFTHVFVPRLNYVDLLAAHMWTGFVVASLPKKPKLENA